MTTHSDKTQERKNQAVINGTTQKSMGGESSFQFVDNRSESKMRMKLQEMAFNSLQTNQAVQLKVITNNKKANTIQKQGSDNEQLLQGKFGKTPLSDNAKHVVQRNGKGKEVVNDLTNPAWQPPGENKTNAGKAAITGAELNILLRGAAIAA